MNAGSELIDAWRVTFDRLPFVDLPTTSRL